MNQPLECDGKQICDCWQVFRNWSSKTFAWKITVKKKIMWCSNYQDADKTSATPLWLLTNHNALVCKHKYLDWLQKLCDFFLIITLINFLFKWLLNIYNSLKCKHNYFTYLLLKWLLNNHNFLIKVGCISLSGRTN